MDRVTALSAESLAALRKLAEAARCPVPGYKAHWPTCVREKFPGVEAFMYAADPDAILALLDELDAREKQIAEWHDEVARFNRGWERRAEPYSALEDEFEQMGYAWANFDKLRAELEAARRERDEARESLRKLDSLPASDKKELADFAAFLGMPEANLKTMESLQSDLAAARAEVEALRADFQRAAAMAWDFGDLTPTQTDWLDAARARWEKKTT